MKKRNMLAGILTTLLMSSLIAGCSKENKPLNIIDDNFRTYYEVFVYSYYDSDGDGIGDLKGLTSKLDYINDNNPETDTDLGCNGLWLMPIMPSPSYHKYDVTNYYDIDPQYGTMEDFDSFIEACHERGINVVLDLVMNHTSSEHPWFKECYSYLQNLPEGKEPDINECPYLEYYHFVKTDEARGKGYCVVSGTQYSYEAPFGYHMPDLNLYNENVRKEFEDITDFWIAKGVDGFRLDAAKEYVSGDVNSNVEILKWYNDYCKSVKDDFYLVAEVWSSASTIAEYYESGIDSIFNYAYGASEGKINVQVRKTGQDTVGESFTNTLVSTQEMFRESNPDYIDASFINNHDNARAAGYVIYNEDRVKLLGGINLMMYGSSFIYYGEELGMKGSGLKDENYRAPMYWSKSKSDGMTKGPDGMEAQENIFAAADKQIKSGDSIFNYYRKAVRLRNENPEIARGTISAVDVGNAKISATKRTYNGNSVYVLINLAGEKVNITLPEDCKISELRGYLSTNGKKATLKGNAVTIPENGIVILK